MDTQTKKTALRMFSYGLYVITSRTESDRSAFLANWVSQCSFEPPMLMLAVEQEAHSLKVIRQSGRLAVNVLESGQRELAGWFGRHHDKVGDKLVNRELNTSPGGLPLLPEALSWVEGKVVGQMPAGDHVLLVAEVVEAGVVREGVALPLKETGFRYAG
ncbi:MAG: flavin reductase family protein [Chloroflexi bacterium]|nr:flavin reductase family protein [Chloroflexota bacterium]